MAVSKKLCVAAALILATHFAPRVLAETPNFVIIFCDDLGYGDLGCFGHPTIRTPQLDRMAAEGMKFTQFYAAACVCTPSRAALMTGRLPIRNGMCGQRRVLFPDSVGGLPQEEITIAEALKTKDYATACVGKWHLGHLPQYLPTQNGFDYYFGIPYSNDMDRVNDSPKGRASFDHPKAEYWNVPLIRNEEIVERPADQTTITKRYTEEAVSFINKHQNQPFFLYLAHSMPHVPLFRSEAFADKSLRGLYGDVIEEIDWSVGQILRTLRDLQLDKRTLVVFTSDNGPWLIFNQQGGSAGLLREGKGSTWEGGMREPTLAWWPGKIEAGSVANDLASTMDLFATIHQLAGMSLPQDRTLDSYDLSPVLFGEGPGRRERFFYYRTVQLFAVRQGPWKAHFRTQPGYGTPTVTEHDPPLLYNLEIDPSEKYNVADQHPDVVAALLEVAREHRAGVEAVTSQLDRTE